MPKNKKMLGANQSRPAKAGKRKAPINKGPHTTTSEMRKEGRWYSKFGLKPKHLQRQADETLLDRNDRIKEHFNKKMWEPYNYPDASYEEMKGWMIRNEAAEHARLTARKKELMDA